ncbi:MAG: SulP family inorganic anion transporter [Wenzhouxiangella sp.]
MKSSISRYFPVLQWSREYNRGLLTSDLVAAAIVTIMLIPQSLAYAMLAGLPPEAGIYASIVPILLYAVFGTSRTLAVGPVAVVSLLTASAIAQVADQGTMGYATAALSLALLSGIFLLLLGLFRLGFIANFLSHPVISGFITASGLLIAVSQFGHLMGVPISGHSLVTMVFDLARQLPQLHPATLVIGLAATAFLFWVRQGFKPLLIRIGLPARSAELLAKAGPLFAVAATTLVVWKAGLDVHGVAIVGNVPRGLPAFTWPDFSLETLSSLALSAVLISIIGFVESISVGQSLAARRRQRIDPDQELIGLGAANIGAAFSGGYPVTGGFARSVVNYDAGAQTPAAGAFTALGLALAAAMLTPMFYYLPRATLAATIIVAVLSLVDFSILRKAWRYSRGDFTAVLATILLTLGFGVETGVLAGVLISIGLHLFKTSRPHVAEVGLVPDTHHFRNVLRHSVKTKPEVLTLRIDESLFFANVRFLEELIQDRVAANPRLRHVVLMCSAVNEIDYSALETLEAINERLKADNIGFHLSEVKGPVMDRLQRSHFLECLNGQVFLSQYHAWVRLTEVEEPPGSVPAVKAP